MSPEVVCHNNVDFDLTIYKKNEIYNRPDTIGIYKHELILKLISLYQQISKHSQYQILPNQLSTYIKSDILFTKSRAEQERFKFITDNISLENKNIIDIGANTGFFSFESITAGVSKIMAYEGNSIHASFINTAIELLNLNNKMTIRGEYYSFSESEKYDVCYLLNVLHHIGDDYQKSTQSKENAKEQIIRQLNNMATICKTMVFQMGYNWKGNINECLFRSGTKSEMISFIKDNTKDYWGIKKIGIAEEIDGSIVYKNLDDHNIKRNDKLGEFLNRPLFIMESLIYK